MFKSIMVPVDLAHADKLERAISVAADMAKHYTAKLTFVGVTTTAPGSVARSPEEFADKLSALAKAVGDNLGLEIGSLKVISHDPTADLDAALIRGLDEVGADLVVMATHLPDMTDMFLPSHGGALARHTKTSVFLVRHD